MSSLPFLSLGFVCCGRWKEMYFREDRWVGLDPFARRFVVYIIHPLWEIVVWLSFWFFFESSPSFSLSFCHSLSNRESMDVTTLLFFYWGVCFWSPNLSRVSLVALFPIVCWAGVLLCFIEGQDSKKVKFSDSWKIILLIDFEKVAGAVLLYSLLVGE